MNCRLRYIATAIHETSGLAGPLLRSPTAMSQITQLCRQGQGNSQWAEMAIELRFKGECR
jgi:hypothetical protein